MQDILEGAGQPSETPAGQGGEEPVGAGSPAATVGQTRLARDLLLLHFVALVLVRLLHEPDDLASWDLTGFLNANSFSTLRELLARPEVHFWNPFSFPQYNCGAESVITAILSRILGHVSLYWTPVVVLLVYDAVFLLLLHVLFKRLYGSILGQGLAWALVSMSPVILTFMSTHAFDMQAFLVLTLGCLGSEYFLQRRAVVGFILFAAAFCGISQGYPLAFYLPYFVVVWCAYRTVGQPPAGVSLRQRALLAAVQLLLLAGFVYLVNRVSKGIYFLKIAPEDPYAGWSGEPTSTRLAHGVELFLRQSFLPLIRQDNVPVGFAPYFLYVVLLVALVGSLRRRGPSRPRGSVLRGLVRAAFSLGLVVFGYLPAFIGVVVKSQRGFFGDLFLVIVLVFWLLRLLENGWIKQTALWSVLVVLLCASDVYYLSFTLSVDHSRNHWPRFDYDLSDGFVHHDLDAVIDTMKRQVDQEHAGLVLYYPREFSENTTDPVVFFGRFLRHFGPYKDRPDVIIPCRWCEAYPGSGIRYGCPFPGVVNQPCGYRCCYTDPLEELMPRGLSGRKLVLWWHVTPPGLDAASIPGVTLESTLQRFAEHYRVISITAPPVTPEWRAFELLPLPAGEGR